VQIAADSVVMIHYTLKDDAGKVLDSSDGGEPLAYIQGHGNLVPGLEKALEGKKDGDAVTVTLSRTRVTARATRRWCSGCRSDRFRVRARSARGCSFGRRPTRVSSVRRHRRGGRYGVA